MHGFVDGDVNQGLVGKAVIKFYAPFVWKGEAPHTRIAPEAIPDLPHVQFAKKPLILSMNIMRKTFITIKIPMALLRHASIDEIRVSNSLCFVMQTGDGGSRSICEIRKSNFVSSRTILSAMSMSEGGISTSMLERGSNKHLGRRRTSGSWRDSD
jgi:hypothetical protein